MPADLAAERQRVLGLIQETTPGEWLREDGLVNGFVFALNGEGTNRMALSISCGLLDNGMRALPKEVHANSALIAAAPALAQSYAEALAELARVREALEWYGEPGNYTDLVYDGSPDGLPVYTTGITEDEGQRARTALSSESRQSEPTACATCLTPVADPATCEICGAAVCPDCECNDEDLLHVWCEACADELRDEVDAPSPGGTP